MYTCDVQELEDVVRDLPNKVSHRVMVPFTDVAFFPGRLVHTNELLVLLGSDLYAERSASQTLDILERRREMLREKIEGAQSSVDAMDSRVAAVDAVSIADGSGGGGGSGARGISRRQPGGLGSIAEEGDDDGVAGAGGGVFATRQDGRATVVEKPDGMVEITEVYDDGEALDSFGEGGVATTMTEGTSRADSARGVTERELEDFIARLEALEAGETDDPPKQDTTAKDDNDEEEEDDDEDQDDEEDVDFASMSSPADMLRFERWKAKQRADGYEVGHTMTREDLRRQVELQSRDTQSERDLGNLEREAEKNAEANKRAAAQASKSAEERDSAAAAAMRRHAAVKNQVMEKGNWTSVGSVRERGSAAVERVNPGGGGGGGSGGSSGGGGGGGGGRPMSKFKMRMMGIDPDAEGEENA